MNLQIITPEKALYNDEIDELILETPNGQIAVLPHHTNLMTEVTPGEIIIKKGNKEISLAVAGGFLQITTGKCIILADYALRTEEIEVEKVLAAQKRAEAVLKNQKESVSERDFALAQSEMRRAILQLDIANKHRRRKITPIK